MGLQVRLRHALGERLMELADRPAERPLVVGRAREADLKIPSVSVAAEHCALFVHEGNWVVQDTSGGSTWVNGGPVAGPTPLYIGDVISLGNDATPAVIEVDPAGVAQGRTGQPAQSNAPAPARAAPPMAAPRPIATATPIAPPGAYYQATPIAPPVSRAPTYAAPPATDEGGFVDWGQPAAASSQSSGGNGQSLSYRRRRKQQSGAPLFIGIVLTIAILGGTSGFVYWKRTQNVQPAPPPKPIVIDSGKRLNNMFDDMNPSAQKPKPRAAVPVSAPAPTDQTPPSAKTKPAGPKDPDADPDTTATPPSDPPANSTPAGPEGHADEKAWQEVEAAHVMPDQAQALLKFDDYRRFHKGDPAKDTDAKDLEAYTDSALNQLWWQRVAQLVKKRNRFLKDSASHEKDLRDETNPKFKKTLTNEKQEIDAQLAKTQDFLNNEMAYTGDEIPDVSNSEMIAKLAATRDADKYKDWKTRTARFILAHHGTTPWAGDD
jgi:FHA domain